MSTNTSILNGRKRPEPIALPEKKTTYVLTNQGKFVEGDLTISREGLQINSPASTLGGTRPGSANSVQPNKRPYQDEDCASSRGSGEASTSGTNGVPSASPARAAPGASSGGAPAGQVEVYDPPLGLGDFEELGVIGQGSSGIAKKVRNKRDGKLMVLKVIQFDVSSDVIRKQVTTELRTLYGADHSNVVHYHAAFFDNGAITIAMEFCDAGSLADLLKARRQQQLQAAVAAGPGGRPVGHPGLPEPAIAHIARQVVAGLHYLHKELKVVHRDIKPSNLLLNSAGEVKISDFGVSGQLASSVSNCLSWVGTVTYMSPERIKGDAYSFDSDLWSLGLTLLECALGRFPYPPPGENPPCLGFWELLEYIVMEPAPALPAEQFSPELVDFVAQCLQKDAKGRPSVASLVQHPFLTKYQDTDLKQVMRDVLKSLQDVQMVAAKRPA